MKPTYEQLEAEVAKWKDSSDGWRKMCHKAEAELTSLKSSLAEKEDIIDRALDEERSVMPRTHTTQTEQILMGAKTNPGTCVACQCNTWNSRSGYCQKCKRLAISEGRFVDPQVKQLQAQLASLKKENADLLKSISRNVREYKDLLKENERLKSDSSSGLSVKYKLELLKQIWKLQLENEVMSSGLTDIRGIHHNCGQCNCALTSGESQCETYQVADKALSTSTKSSLMEKVRGLIEAAEPFVRDIDKVVQVSRAERRLESALTEVKKELL